MERSEILNTLKLAAPALLPESEVVLPILKSFKFQDGRVMASNDVIAVSLAANVGVEGIVVGKKLMTFLSNCRTKEINFSKTSKGSVVVKAGSSRLTLSSEPLEEWPFEFPDIEKSITKRVQKDFFVGLDMCSFQSPNTGVEGWSGSIILNFGEDLEIYGVGRGRSTISYFRASSVKPSKKSRRLVLPSSFCKTAVAMSGAYGEKAKLHMTNDCAVIEWGDAESIIAGKYVNVDPPNVEDTFSQVSEGEHHFVKISEEMKESFKRASALSDKGVVSISSSDKGLLLEAKSELGSKLKEEIQLESELPDIDVEIAANLIIKRLDDCSDMAFSDSATIMKNEDESFVYLAANHGEGEEAGDDSSNGRGGR